MNEVCLSNAVVRPSTSAERSIWYLRNALSIRQFLFSLRMVGAAFGASLVQNGIGTFRHAADRLVSIADASERADESINGRVFFLLIRSLSD